MKRKFVMTSEFDKQWKAMGLGDNELRKLQQQILENPKSAPVIKGTGGLRKIRFTFEGKGKIGSARVTYVDFVIYDVVYLIYAYTKNEKDNLSKAECANIKKLITAIEKALGKGE